MTLSLSHTHTWYNGSGWLEAGSLHDASVSVNHNESSFLGSKTFTELDSRPPTLKHTDRLFELNLQQRQQRRRGDLPACVRGGCLTWPPWWWRCCPQRCGRLPRSQPSHLPQKNEQAKKNIFKLTCCVIFHSSSYFPWCRSFMNHSIVFVYIL